jgi:hypothetical protein
MPVPDRTVRSGNGIEKLETADFADSCLFDPALALRGLTWRRDLIVVKGECSLPSPKTRG